MTHLELLFPGLRGTAYRITSAYDSDYNCIAWAVGDTTDWWWPVDDPKIKWPPTVPLEVTINAFEVLFTSLGYEACAGESLEAGFGKIALFAWPTGRPTHAARQLPSGKWTSKLGKSEDIEHDLRAVEGDVYGHVVRLFRRPVP